MDVVALCSSQVWGGINVKQDVNEKEQAHSADFQWNKALKEINITAHLQVN